MKLQRLMLLGGIGLFAAACQKDAGPFYPDARASAYIRYINAVPDTGLLDFKFVDKVEGSPWFELRAFRDVTNYQAADAGTRHIKVFNGQNASPMNEPSYVTQVHVDTNLTFEAGKYYTILHTGTARGVGRQSRLVVIEDPRPAVAAGQVAVRVIHTALAGGSLGNVDVLAATDTGAALTGTALFSNVAPGTVGAYLMRTTGKFISELANAGDATQLSETTPPAGAQAATSAQSNQGGYSIAGSMLTAFVFPRSVAGSPAPQTSAFTRPGIVWMQDNRP
jgi:hypothetical protein